MVPAPSLGPKAVASFALTQPCPVFPPDRNATDMIDRLAARA